MVAYADFPFNSLQQATMTYINAAPQWQTFNGKNWNELEHNVRTLVGILNQDIIVYTGTYVSILFILNLSSNKILFSPSRAKQSSQIIQILKQIYTLADLMASCQSPIITGK